MIGMYKGDWDRTGGEFRKHAKRRVNKIRKMMTIDQSLTNDWQVSRRIKIVLKLQLHSTHSYLVEDTGNKRQQTLKIKKMVLQFIFKVL